MDFQTEGLISGGLISGIKKRFETSRGSANRNTFLKLKSHNKSTISAAQYCFPAEGGLITGLIFCFQVDRPITRKEGLLLGWGAYFTVCIAFCQVLFKLKEAFFPCTLYKQLKEEIRKTVEKIVAQCVSSTEQKVRVLKTEADPKDFHCYKQAVRAFSKNCYNLGKVMVTKIHTNLDFRVKLEF